MKLLDLKWRDIDRNYFFIEDEKDIKKIYRKLHIKKDINPVLITGYIKHDEGIQIRVLGNIVINDDTLEIEYDFIKNDYSLSYDYCENLNIKPIPHETIEKISNLYLIKNEINGYYLDSELLETRKNKVLDQYRDIRLVDDVQFLLLNREKQMEGVWARIIGVEKDMFKCVLLDKVDKSFNLKPNDKIYIKYLVHPPKFTGLIFVKKV